MKIVVGRPPNFEAIAAVFPAARRLETIFTYGETVYISHDHQLPIWLIEHENVHIAQQETGPECWWQTYLANKAFRFQQELVAHRKEYEVLIANGNRILRRRAAQAISGRLAGPLYGHCCTKALAKRCLLSKEWPSEIRSS